MKTVKFQHNSVTISYMGIVVIIKERSRVNRSIEKVAWSSQRNCVSIVGLSQSLQILTHWNMSSCCLPILPKWSKHTSVRTALFSSSFLTCPRECILNMILHLLSVEICLHLSRGREFQRWCFVWDMNTLLNYTTRLLPFALRGKGNSYCKRSCAIL